MNFILVFLICFVIFVLWMFYEQRKSQNKDKEASDAFWERERMANQTRKKDISHLPILHVEESELPLITTENESVLYYIDHIRKIIKSPMLDLSEYSNTDLKLAYGVGNFKVLCEYDENFNHFLLALTNLARACTEAGLYSEAEQTFLLAFHYGSQKMTDYTSLADIYLHLEEPEKISALIRNVKDGSLPHKEALIQALEQKLMAYR